jgi:hypothetical protein
MKNLHTVSQSVIKISTLLLLYVIEIQSIPRVKIHTMREYNPTSIDSKTVLRLPSSSGISNMVSSGILYLLSNVFNAIDRGDPYHV